MTNRVDHDQIELIVDIDQRARRLLAGGEEDKTVIRYLLPEIDHVKALLESLPKKAMQLYCWGYEGFAYFVSLLENCSNGRDLNPSISGKKACRSSNRSIHGKKEQL